MGQRVQTFARPHGPGVRTVTPPISRTIDAAAIPGHNNLGHNNHRPPQPSATATV